MYMERMNLIVLYFRSGCLFRNCNSIGMDGQVTPNNIVGRPVFLFQHQLCMVCVNAVDEEPGLYITYIALSAIIDMISL